MTSRRKNEEKEFWKIGGLILQLFALPILIMVAVLLNMPDIDRSTTGILLLIGICLFFSGLILSHLPQETKNKEKMKMSKFRVAVLVLLAVTVVYALMLASNLWSYYQIPTEGYDPILGHWYGNPKPFNVTSEGQKFSAVGISLFFTWFAVAWISLGREQKRNGEMKIESEG